MQARPKANLCLLPHLSMASSKGLGKCCEMRETVSVRYGRVCREFRMHSLLAYVVGSSKQTLRAVFCLNDWAGNLGRQILNKPLDVIAVHLNTEVCYRGAKGIR